MQPLFRIQPAYDLPRLKLLPLREQPAYRVVANSDSCNLLELLAALIGGPQQTCPERCRRVEIAEAVLARFPNLTCLQQAHVCKIAEVNDIGRPTKSVAKQTVVRLKAALALAKKALQETEAERTTIHNPANAAVLVQYEMSLLEQEHLRVILLLTPATTFRAA